MAIEWEEETEDERRFAYTHFGCFAVCVTRYSSGNSTYSVRVDDSYLVEEDVDSFEEAKRLGVEFVVRELSRAVEAIGWKVER